jgi:hypothetical protein
MDLLPSFLRAQPLPASFPQITLGRATKDNQIDVDLSLEGPAWKISRKQGTPTRRPSKEQCPLRSIPVASQDISSPGALMPFLALGLGSSGYLHGPAEAG